MRRLTLALTLSLGLVPPATATLAEVSADKRALVDELLELYGSAEVSAPISQMILAQLEPVFGSLVDEVLDSEPGLSPAERERLRNELGDFPAFATEFNARFPERVDLEVILRQVYLPLYDAAFEEEELRDIVAFYRSPAGQKMLRVMPAIGEQGMRDTLPRVEPRVMALVGEILAIRRDELER